MKKQKQIIASLLLAASIFSMIPSISAQAATKITQPKVIEYTLSDTANLYKYGLESNYAKAGDISLDRYDEPSDAVILGRPVYTHYNNRTSKLAINFIVGAVFFKGASALSSTAAKYVTGFISANLIKFLSGSAIPDDTYVGSWMWTSGGRKYATLVHYSDPNYNNPINVQIIDVTNY